jgi:hypothetical protein
MSGERDLLLQRQLLQPHVLLLVILELAKDDVHDILSLSGVSRAFRQKIFGNWQLLRPLIRAAFACATSLGMRKSTLANMRRRLESEPRELALAALRAVHRLRERARKDRENAEAFLHLRVKLWHALSVILRASGVASSCRHMLATCNMSGIRGRTLTVAFNCRACELLLEVRGAMLAEFGIDVHHEVRSWLISRVPRRYYGMSLERIRRYRSAGIRRRSADVSTPACVQLHFATPQRDAVLKFSSEDGDQDRGRGFLPPFFTLNLTAGVIDAVQKQERK